MKLFNIRLLRLRDLLGGDEECEYDTPGESPLPEGSAACEELLLACVVEVASEGVSFGPNAVIREVDLGCELAFTLTFCLCLRLLVSVVFVASVGSDAVVDVAAVNVFVIFWAVSCESSRRSGLIGSSNSEPR